MRVGPCGIGGCLADVNAVDVAISAGAGCFIRVTWHRCQILFNDEIRKGECDGK